MMKTLTLNEMAKVVGGQLDGYTQSDLKSLMLLYKMLGIRLDEFLNKLLPHYYPESEGREDYRYFVINNWSFVSDPKFERIFDK